MTWSQYQKILTLRSRYLIASKGKKSLLKIIYEAELPEQVYNSNAIENSTLSLQETEKVLLKIDLDRFISERELFESRNLAKVMEYIYQNVWEKSLSIDMILFLHKVLLSNIHDEIAGRFRKTNEWVKIRNHIGSDPKMILSQIEDMFVHYQMNINKNIIQRIAFLHLEFEHIHPFVDGNGRMWRVINNYLLMQEWFVPINIKFIDRALYYDAFQEFDGKRQTKIMEDIIYKALTNSYHKRLAYLEWKKIISLKEYAKQEKTSHSNVINKAKRQTIEAFIEKWVWKIWV